MVLRSADGEVTDVTFLGAGRQPVGRRAGTASTAQIRRWLAGGQVRDDAWLVADADAPDGTAVDLSAWRAAG